MTKTLETRDDRDVRNSHNEITQLVGEATCPGFVAFVCDTVYEIEMTFITYFVVPDTDGVAWCLVPSVCHLRTGDLDGAFSLNVAA